MQYQINPEITELSKDGRQKLDRLFYHCNTMLGGTSINVYLESDDYNFAFENAVNFYRSRSTRSINQTFGYMELQPNVQTYKLHERVDVVSKINRSSGLNALSSQQFDPFVGAVTNGVLGVQANGGAALDLATYDFTLQRFETMRRLFAEEMNFSYRNEVKELMIFQVPKKIEKVVLELSVLKTMHELLEDHFAYTWLQKYTLAQSKIILGRKLSMFLTVPGPTGGTSIRGDALLDEGFKESEELENDLLVWSDDSDISLPIRG